MSIAELRNTLHSKFTLSLVKRTINGTHRWISKKYTNKYLAEMTMRYNSRETSEGLRLNDIMSNLNGRLSYKKLIGRV